MTEPQFISEPVADKVKTEPKGSAFSTIMRFSKISQGSFPSKQTPAAINLTASRTEPPPTAKIKSIDSA